VRRTKPATTPEQRENQLIALSADLAERQLRDGTASAQVISHFLKLGSSREFLEQERLRLENTWTQARVDALASQQRVEELYAEALTAMKRYTGEEPIAIEADYDD
jgi:hypothetical protein